MNSAALTLAVACPHCRAAAGQPCRSTVGLPGRPLGFLHLERERAYDQAVAR